MGRGGGGGGGRGGKKASKDEKAMQDEARRLKREHKRAQKRVDEQKKVDDLDVLGMARHELGIKEEDPAKPNASSMQWQHGADDDSEQHTPHEEEDDTGGIIGFVKWLFARPKAPPKEWETFRRDEIDNYISERRASLIGKLWPESFYFSQMKNPKLKYWGDYDIYRRREGRGVCLWPDPPKGGGESYYGLWRADLPNGHGVFRWFTGDVYMGQWSNGLEQGFGVYRYGPYGEFQGDRYEGMYFGGSRQGTGSYFYAGGFDEDDKPVPGGVYLGEWLKGKMHGLGILSYSDGEYYVGAWKYDKKEGMGVYVWGMGSGEVAGDKYEGGFKNGNCHGNGRTMFNDGGWHKGLYRNGKMHGHGVMQTSDGWEYIGQWKDDELHGEVVCTYVFGFNAAKEVQIYENGDKVRQRKYDTSRDWAQIESLALEAARDGERRAVEARNQMSDVTVVAKRAKQSQLLGRDAMEEGIYYLKASLTYKAYLLQWMGLRKFLNPIDA